MALDQPYADNTRERSPTSELPPLAHESPPDEVPVEEGIFPGLTHP